MELTDDVSKNYTYFILINDIWSSDVIHLFLRLKPKSEAYDLILFYNNNNKKVL